MYPTGNTAIGTLLRMIQEDQNKSIAAAQPASDPNSPIRQVVQGPLTSPEDPGSTKVVSVRPEGATQSAQSITPQPNAPLGTNGAVVAPIAPHPIVAPVASPAPSSSPAPSAPSAPSRPSTPTPAPVATKISVPQFKSTPQRARIGVPIAKAPSIGTRLRATA